MKYEVGDTLELSLDTPGHWEAAQEHFRLPSPPPMGVRFAIKDCRIKCALVGLMERPKVQLEVIEVEAVQ